FVANPGEPLEHVRTVSSKPQGLSEAFVDGGVSVSARGLVLDHEDRHRRRDNSGHGTGRAVVVRRSIFDVVCSEPARSNEIGGQTLEHQRTSNRSLHGGLHIVPVDRRAGVQYELAMKAWQNVAGGSDANELRSGSAQGVEQNVVLGVQRIGGEL